ncbi:MAG TPA: hypothetical protein ENJ95_04220 [Bacteroidetes bacterium]|nr:hypothetical protein [Bacteroidota bacterium]
MKNFTKKLAAISIGIFVALLFLEIACQALYAFMVAPQLESQKNDDLHYYEANENPALTYSLRPGYHFTKKEKGRKDRRININKYGIRSDTDSTNAAQKVALFGDSVPFGNGVSQEDSPPACLQRLAGDSIHILNFGTPGYGLEELPHHLRAKYPVYRPQTLYYVLNLNDFSRRNTIYEGGDNGLYRIYNKPGLKLPFFIRKAVYRYIKEGKMSSVKWYKWLYEGNKKELLPLIKEMAGYAKSNGSVFKVVLFPAAVGYQNGHFALQGIFDEITRYCEKNGIPVIAPVAEFSQNVYKYQDITDHFTPAGSEVIAKVIWEDMKG